MTATSMSATDPGEHLAGWLHHDPGALELAVRMVQLLVDLPGVRSMETQVEWEQVAWAAVALRRGRRDGRRVNIGDLEELILDPMVIKTVWVIGGDRRRDEEHQRGVALATSEITRLVWVVYWISRVKQAKATKKRSTWMTLAARAEKETEVVLRDVPDPQRAWFRERLDEARHPRKA